MARFFWKCGFRISELIIFLIFFGIYTPFLQFLLFELDLKIAGTI